MTNLSLNDLQLIFYRRRAQPGQTIALADEADISSGVEAALYPFHRWTLYLRAAGEVDVTLELSPDGGATFFTPEESPVKFSQAGDMIIEMGYDATHIRLTGSDGTLITAFIRGLM